ncbi:SH3 domain-containing protein [Cohnella pontilimi]|uniref:SH3 domain-containing protein n=1 Tax=Cohnella pontilimi TaxID=2564100 RepID=A0A4U0F6L2_9BACL|nr:SH3 domain-containing protein [Cohnella pontilimi]TJY39574.1 SH3 domain-containing protein [Cohnella pontilimi]
MIKRFGLIMVLTVLMLTGCGSHGSKAADSSSIGALPAVTEPNESEPSNMKTSEPKPAESPSADPAADAKPSPQQETYKAFRIEPVDESSQNRIFATFREELMKKIDERDLNYIKEHLDPHVRFSFGGDEAGAEGLIKEWDETRWMELERALQLGGVFTGRGNDQKMFVAPYVFELFDKLPEQLDAFTYGVAVEKDVKVYADRSESSQVLDVLDYTVVKMEYEEGGWTPVITPSGYGGYVKQGQVRSPIDYRVIFNFQDDNWKIITFVAGD